MPFSRGEARFFVLRSKEGKGTEKRKKQKTINKEGLGPSEVAFGPPHLTLKPSKKNKKKRKQKNKKQKQQKQQKQITDKEGLGPSEVALRATSPDP